MPDTVGTTPPLTSQQRVQLRGLLDRRWRNQVLALTDLAVQFHAAEAERDGSTRERLGRRLAGVRRSLVDIEAAMNRLDARSYGWCDACDRRLPFEHLELTPELRYCRACLRPAS